MDRDQALAKIKKCLALGRSANEHEAATAMRQAQKLMEQFDVDATDVELSEVSESRTKAAMAVLVSWETELGHMVADAFGCLTYITRSRLPGQSLFMRPQPMRVFVGVGQAAEIASYTFEVLSRQCQRARSAHIAAQPRNCKQVTKTARGDRFALYWVLAVQELVEAFAGSDRRVELLETYMQREHPDMVEVKAKRRDVGRNVRHEDSWAGAEAGRKASLPHGVSHEARKAIER
jgi:hypothetical protein